MFLIASYRPNGKESMKKRQFLEINSREIEPFVSVHSLARRFSHFSRCVRNVVYGPIGQRILEKFLRDKLSMNHKLKCTQRIVVESTVQMSAYTIGPSEAIRTSLSRQSSVGGRLVDEASRVIKTCWVEASWEPRSAGVELWKVKGRVARGDEYSRAECALRKGCGANEKYIMTGKAVLKCHRCVGGW